MKAALYVRVSTGEQVKGFGIDAQITHCTQYCNAFGLEVVKTYVDAGVSGTLPYIERPELNAAIQECETYDLLVTAAIDRIGRKANIVLNIWDTLEANNISIVAVKERVDTSTPAGKLHRTMLAAIAEFERDNIVQRTSDGKNERAKVDGDNGGAIHYGYTRVIQRTHNIVVNPKQASVVQLIFDLKARGLSLHKIAKHLNDAATPTPKNGKVWYAKTVSIILANEKVYRGSNRGNSDYQYPTILESE